MPLDPRYIVKCAWAGTGLIWLAASFTTKRTARRQPMGILIAHMVALLAGFELMFAAPLRIGFLGARFLPEERWVSWTGCTVTLAGLAFTIWARFFLGRNWSGDVAVKQDHTLVRGGPYALVRHPIYAGLSLGLLGTAAIYGEVRCLLGAALIIAEWKRKSQLEERFMLEQFGEQYAQYRREVKALIPYVW